MMYEEVILLGLALWLGLPAWIANSMPVIFGGGRPIDNGKVLSDGKRLFGDNKTIRGFISGVVLGTLTSWGLNMWAPYVREFMTEHVSVTPEMDAILGITVFGGFLLSLGALIGDLVGSFFKRRASLKGGAPAFMLDQLGFIIMALIFLAPLLTPAPQYVAVIILFTLAIHWVSNVAGYLLKLKKTPW